MKTNALLLSILLLISFFSCTNYNNDDDDPQDVKQLQVLWKKQIAPDSSGLDILTPRLINDQVVFHMKVSPTGQSPVYTWVAADKTTGAIDPLWNSSTQVNISSKVYQWEMAGSNNEYIVAAGLKDIYLIDAQSGNVLLHEQTSTESYSQVAIGQDKIYFFENYLHEAKAKLMILDPAQMQVINNYEYKDVTLNNLTVYVPQVYMKNQQEHLCFQVRTYSNPGDTIGMVLASLNLSNNYLSWVSSYLPGYDDNVPGGYNEVVAPLITTDNNYIFGALRNVYSLNVLTGALNWNYAMPAGFTGILETRPLMLQNGKLTGVFVSGEIFAWDANSGGLLWQHTVPKVHAQSDLAAYKGDIMISSTHDIANSIKPLRVLSSSTGDIIMHFDDGDSFPINGNILVDPFTDYIYYVKQNNLVCAKIVDAK